MTVFRPSLLGCIALGVTVAGAAGFSLIGTRALQPAVPQVAEAPACSSCDARHARLAALHPKTVEGTE